MKKLVAIVVVWMSVASCGYSQSSVKVCPTDQPAGQTYFENGFEEGDFSSWTGYNTNWKVSVESAPAAGHGTYSGQYWYTICSDSGTQAATTGSDVAGGSQPGTYYFKYVYVQLNGSYQSVLGSSEASHTVASSNLLKVASPASGKAFYLWDVYVGTASGGETKQNASPLTIGQDWTMPTTGLISGSAYPGSFVGCPGGSWTRQSWKNISPALSHFFLRAYVYFKTPETGGTRDVPLQKVFWLQDASGTWNSILSMSSAAGAISFTHGRNATCGMTQVNAFANAGSKGWDTWIRIEEEIQLNTAGQSDGIVRLWLDGTLVGENTAYQHRGTCSTDFGQLALGYQANVSAGTRIDEKRYWDDVKISNLYIGP